MTDKPVDRQTAAQIARSELRKYQGYASPLAGKSEKPVNNAHKNHARGWRPRGWGDRQLDEYAEMLHLMPILQLAAVAPPLSDSPTEAEIKEYQEAYWEAIRVAFHNLRDIVRKGL